MSCPRTIATDVLQRVLDNDAFSHLALDQALRQSDLDERDRALCTTLVYGTLTWLRRLDEELRPLVSRDLEGLDRPVLISLRMALFQILFLDRIPDHAAVDRAVAISKKRCGRGASGFTNGVLRNWLRKRQDTPIWEGIDPTKEPTRYLAIRYSLPDWLASYLIDQSGLERAQERASVLTEQAPLTFRITSPALLEQLDHPLISTSQPIDGMPLAHHASGMNESLRKALDEGDAVIQDLGSQLIGCIAASAIANRPCTVLDACAGLGGKALHLAQELGDQAVIHAVDPHESKLNELKKAAQRNGLGDQIQCHATTLGDLPSEMGPQDLVLVDAPCTGLGVIRRHPETRWRRQPDDIANRAQLQRQLLDEAAPFVAPGGHLMYSVCSFTDEEGPQVIEYFLEQHPEFERSSPREGLPEAYWSAINERQELRLEPADFGCDAFFGALLQRTES